MANLTWNKVGTGTYETSNRRFQARKNDNSWMLLGRNDDVTGNWEWYQSYDLLRDVKNGAQYINDNS